MYQIFPGSVVPVDGRWGFTYRDNAGDMFTHSERFTKAHEAKAFMRAWVARGVDTPYKLTEKPSDAAGFTDQAVAMVAIAKYIMAIGDTADAFSFGTALARYGNAGGVVAYAYNDRSKKEYFLAQW